MAALRAHVAELTQVTDQSLEPIQENAYRLATQPAYFVKLIADEDRLGQNELRVHQDILKKAQIPRPELVYQMKIPGATIACWDWLEGTDLRYQGRDWLVQAFEHLGRFHAQQRHEGPLESPVTQRRYDTVEDLLEVDLATLVRQHPETVRKAALKARGLLGMGYATFIHGDMHPGNLRLAREGLKFVDWGYCIPSLNLFDLGYIETVELDDPGEGTPWWTILPGEACLVLPAYFAACGMGGVDYDQVQLAVMFWSKLWAYENCVKFGNSADAVKVANQLMKMASLLS